MRRGDEGVISAVMNIPYKKKGISDNSEIPLFIAGVPSRI